MPSLTEMMQQLIRVTKRVDRILGKLSKEIGSPKMHGHHQHKMHQHKMHQHKMHQHKMHQHKMHQHKMHQHKMHQHKMQPSMY